MVNLGVAENEDEIIPVELNDYGDIELLNFTKFS